MSGDGGHLVPDDSTESIDSDDESPVRDNAHVGSKGSQRRKTTNDVPAAESLARKNPRKRRASQMQDDNEDDLSSVTSEHGGHSRKTSGSSTTSQLCLCPPEQRIPRPRNAFILYRQHHQAALLQQNPSLTNPEISRIIGEQWKRQPDEVQLEWKKLAEEEKSRHQQTYPEYRYQPRRGGRRNSTADSPTSASSAGRCNKCGGRTMVSPSTPHSTQGSRPMLPPPVPSSTNGYTNTRYMPVMNNHPSASPRTQKNGRHVPANINVPALADYPDDDRYMISPDAKRRRFSNSIGYIPVNNRPSVGTPYPMITPYRESFQRYEPPRHAHTNSVIPAPTLPSHAQAKQYRQIQDKSLTLPPIQPNGDLNKSVEATVMGIDPPRKIRILGRISPPLNMASVQPVQSKTRGAVISVEGDNPEITTEVARWLDDFLSRSGEYRVRFMDGPTAPENGKEATISDYFTLISTWHAKGREIVDYITTTPSPQPNGTAERHNSKSPSRDSGSDTTAAPQPVVLLNRYQLFASNTYACRIPINDVYPPVDHWQWMATMWRSIVGPDATVYVKEASPEELAAEKTIELREDIRCLVVRRAKGPGPLQEKVEEKNLRRLGFELGECIRSAGQERKEEAPQKNG